MIPRCPDCDEPVLEKIKHVAWVTLRVYLCPTCNTEWAPGVILGLKKWPDELSIRAKWLPDEAWRAQELGEIVIVRFQSHYTVLILP